MGVLIFSVNDYRASASVKLPIHNKRGRRRGTVVVTCASRAHVSRWVQRVMSLFHARVYPKDGGQIKSILD
jgi:hypothetical protein